MKKYCVVYRTGGTERFQWHRTVAILDFDDAVECMRNTMHMGFTCVVEDYDMSMAIGLPDTYDYKYAGDK
jgi:hypothetical protein